MAVLVIPNFMKNSVINLKGHFSHTFEYAKLTFRKAVFYAVFLIILLWLSIFIYGSFLFSYMPKPSLQTPVFLTFSVCEDGVNICTYPTANVTFPKGDDDTAFFPGLKYRIELQVDVPESQTNKNIGMIMTEIQLYNNEGKIITSSLRHAILEFRSDLLRILDTFVFSPFLLFGFSMQKQTLKVEFFAEYLDNPYNPCVGAILKIHSLKLEMYKSKILVHANYSGFRYILFHWPVTSSIVGVASVFFILFSATLLSVFKFGKPSLVSNKKKKSKLPPNKKAAGIKFQTADPENIRGYESFGEVEEQEDDATIPDCDTKLRRRPPSSLSSSS